MDRLNERKIILFVVAVWLSSCTAFVPISVQPYVPLHINIPTVKGARIFFIGDTQRTAPFESWREQNDAFAWKLIRQTVKRKPDAIILLGDLVYWGSSDIQWRYFDTLLQPLRRAKIPVTTVMGNHDYYGSNNAALFEVERRFGVSADSSRILVVDSVAFVLLNTNRDEFSQKQLLQQRKWFVKNMAQLDTNVAIQAIVVCGHHPPYTNNSVVGDEVWLQKYFVPAYTKSKKGLLWLSGHAHGYEHIIEKGKTFIISAGGGGPRASLLNKENNRHTDVSGLPLKRPLHSFEVQRIGTSLQCTMHPEESEKAFGEQFIVSVVR